MDNETHTPINSTEEIVPKLPDASQNNVDKSQQRRLIIGFALAGIIIIGLLVLAIIYLVNPTTPTTRIRDIVIIFMALEFLVVGAALVILIIQLASLINLLQNEVKPILENTNETSRTLRGTALFLSDNLVEPVIKLGGYVASMQRVMSLIGLIRKPKD